MDKNIDTIKKYLKIRSNNVAVEPIDKNVIENLYNIKQENDGYSVCVFPFAGRNNITKKINELLFTSYLVIPSNDSKKTIVKKVHSTKFLMGIIVMRIKTLKMNIEGKIQDVYMEKPIFYHYLLLSVYSIFSITIIRKIMIVSDGISPAIPYILLYSVMLVWLHKTKELVLYPFTSIILFAGLIAIYFLIRI